MVKYIRKSLKKRKCQKNKGGAFFPFQETVTTNKPDPNQANINTEPLPSNHVDDIKSTTSTTTSSSPTWLSWFFGSKITNPFKSSSSEPVTETNNQTEKLGGKTLKTISAKNGKSKRKRKNIQKIHK